jgi:hypothetical protein
MSGEERHSKALEIELISDPEQRARQEAENGLRQFDEVIERINYSQPSTAATGCTCRSISETFPDLFVTSKS